MSNKDQKSFMIEEARILFRNFAGAATKFNAAGLRNFCVELPTQVAQQMSTDGWNVKVLPAREEGDDDQFYIKVNVSYKFRPPRVVLVTSSGKQHLSESQLEILDWADITSVDLICNGFDWENGDKRGTSAYLKSLFVIIEEDELERKYSVNAMPDIRQEPDAND